MMDVATMEKDVIFYTRENRKRFKMRKGRAWYKIFQICWVIEMDNLDWWKC